MSKINLRIVVMFVAIVGVTGFMIFFPELSFAQVIGGGGFEGKLQNLTNSIINVILPAVSILGLVYAAILAVTGDGAARQRMIFVVIASIVGFLAPIIIGWFKSAAGA